MKDTCTISAQTWGAQSVTVEGTVQLQNGQIAVASGRTYNFPTSGYGSCCSGWGTGGSGRRW
ncbi:MAG: hypothetical protein LBI14_02260 [Treponema sp.]|jgi:hypothetical protein|nr:hypothetical protein [Treponema sp.]